MCFFCETNRYSNNSRYEHKLIVNCIENTEFCTDCCFVWFTLKKYCHLLHMLEPIIMTVHPRAKGNTKFGTNKTILGAIVYAFNQYPIDSEPLKNYW